MPLLWMYTRSTFCMFVRYFVYHLVIYLALYWQYCTPSFYFTYLFVQVFVVSDFIQHSFPIILLDIFILMVLCEFDVHGIFYWNVGYYWSCDGFPYIQDLASVLTRLFFRWYCLVISLLCLFSLSDFLLPFPHPHTFRYLTFTTWSLNDLVFCAEISMTFVVVME